MVKALLLPERCLRGCVGQAKRRHGMSRDKAEKANIAARETRRATDEPTLKPSFDPLVNIPISEASALCLQAWPRGSSGKT
jgi:hypothetical protein